MDLQSLSQLFTTTLSPDPNVRKAGELQIRSIEGQEGMIAAVLQLIATDAVDIATRQACTVWLKNRVNHNYSVEVASRPDQAVVQPSDREALRTRILHLLATAPSKSISLPLANTLKAIVAHDYPSNWPSLGADLKKLLTSNNVQEVHAGCIASLEAVRAFRYRQTPDILPSLVAELFPVLLDIAKHAAAQPPTSSQEVPTLLHLILKAYRTSIIINLSQHQQSPESLMPWGQLLFAVINIQLPPGSVPDDLEERERSEWWKAKKWACAILGRLFHRFGNPSQLPTALKSEYGAFSQQFATVFAPQILNTYLQQINLSVTNQAWLSNKCKYQIIHFMTECIKPKATWALLKPHYETLVSTFIFGHLTFNEEKRTLWESDPVDYLRVTVDEYETYTTPASAATTFLMSLAMNRTKVTFLPILGIINTVLRSQAPPEQRFGALNMTAALGPYIMRHPEVKNGIEQFVIQFVSPQLQAPEPYVRCIALEVIGTLVKQGFVFTNHDLLLQHFQAVFNALEDPNLPIKVQAALVLNEFITHFESVREAMAPQVGKFIQDLLKLSDETDLDLLNGCLENMVDSYQNELLPVATSLTSRLCDSYLRLARESAALNHIEENADLDDLIFNADDDKSFAALSVAKTIGTIINCVDENLEILAQIREVVIPIVMFSFENRLFDQFDHMYDLVDNLTFKFRAISPTMWPIFEATYKMFKEEAIDFLDEMIPCLDNFICFGSDVIRSKPEYLRMLVDIYTTATTSDQLGENDRTRAGELIESVLLNLRGAVDEYLEVIINTALGLIPSIETTTLRIANTNVLINAVLYNPKAALHFIEAFEVGMARTFLTNWFELVNNEKKITRVHDVKLSILALSALLEMQPESIPEALRDGWPSIVGMILRLLVRFPKSLEARQRQQEEEEEEEEDSDDVATLNLADNEDDIWDEESRYMEVLVQAGIQLRQKAEKEEGISSSDLPDELSDREDEIKEDLGFLSPLEPANPYVQFKRSLTAFQMQNGPAYQASTTSLSVEEQTALMEIMRIAAEQEAAEAS